MDNYSVYTFCHLGYFRDVNIWEAQYGGGGLLWEELGGSVDETKRDKSLMEPELYYCKTLKGCALRKFERRV